MAEDPKPPTTPAGSGPAETPPQAAADKPPAGAPAEPLKGEVSRTDSPGAGASAAPVATPRAEPPAPKPENPAAATTATLSETSSATGQPTAPAQGTAAQPASVAAPTPPAQAGAPAPPKAAASAQPSATAQPSAPARPAPSAAKAAGAAHAPPAPAPPSGPPDPPPPADKTPPAFITSLQSRISGSVSQISYWVGDWTIIVPVAQILQVAQHLRDAPDAAFDMCSDLTATDWPPRAERFDVVYSLYSTRHRHRVRVKVKVGENQPIPSVTGIWPSTNWLEREVYDMFGVNFTGHPDRRRILMPEDWQGFPQRKDYPLEGPGELLMENPLDWLKLRQAQEEAEIE